MMDCKATITCTDDKIKIKAEDTSLVELVCMFGYFGSFIVWEAVKRGMTADDIKDKFLDIFLALTADLTDEKVNEILEGK